MHKFVAYSLWGGLGVAGAALVAVSTGVLSVPGLKDEVAAPLQTDAVERVPAPAPVAEATRAVPQPVAVPDERKAPEPEPVTAESPVVPPSFDLVRVEPEGMALVAGKGTPGALIDVLVDGAAQVQAEVSPGGGFTGFLDLPPSDKARVLRLRQTLGDNILMSEADVIVAPNPVPEEQLAAVPAPAEETTVASVVTAAAPIADGSDLADPDAPVQADVIEAPAEQAQAAADAEPAVTAAETADPVATGRDAAAQDEDGIALLEMTPPLDPAAPAVDPSPPIKPDTPARPPVPPTDAEAPGVAVLGQDAPPTPSPVAAPVKIPARPEAPAILLSSARGVEVLSTGPLAPGDVALDAISYDAAGEVLLSGRGDTSAYVRIYLDNKPLTDSRIEEDGRWRITLPEVDTGTYTLRVDQLDAEGAVTARVESPFLRESQQILEAAAQGEGPVRSVTVQPGATLWAIAQDRYGDGIEYVRVFRANRDRIRNPDLIYPGQIFDLPDE